MTRSPLLLLLDALAVYRLVRLIGTDVILLDVREWLVGRAPAGHRDLSGYPVMRAARPWIADLLGCPWCLSVWAAIPVVALQALAPAVCLYVSAVLAFSAVAGFLSETARLLERH